MLLPVDSPYDLLPGGRRVKGGNVIPKPEQVALGNTVWAQFWSEWDWPHISEQILRAVDLGCNTLRIIGSVRAVVGGFTTQAAYLANVRQVLDFCYDQNLYVYVCGGAQNDQNSITATQREQEIAALAASVDSAPHVMGIDVLQESYNQLPIGQMSALIGAARAETDLPLTFSLDGPRSKDLLTGTANGLTYMAEMKDVVDFFDVHLYYNPAAGDIPTNYWPATSKPLLCGEFGSNASEATNIRQLRFNSVKSNLHDSVTDGKRPAGSLVWALGDQDTAASNQWGVFDLNGTERTDTGSIFRTYEAGAVVDFPARSLGSAIRLGGQTRTARLLVGGVERTFTVQ